jgi:hypothetical protein
VLFTQRLRGGSDHLSTASTVRAVIHNPRRIDARLAKSVSRQSQRHRFFGGGARIDVGQPEREHGQYRQHQTSCPGAWCFDEAGQTGPRASSTAGPIKRRPEGGPRSLWVAPHCSKNDGQIQARLGRVILGGRTIPSPSISTGWPNQPRVHPGSRRPDARRTGQAERAVSSLTRGEWKPDGAQVVLIAAPLAKSVARSGDQPPPARFRLTPCRPQGGRSRIAVARAGAVEVTRIAFGAHGQDPCGKAEASIDVLGDWGSRHAGFRRSESERRWRCRWRSIHVGGAFQGRGDTHQAETTP